MFKHGFTVVEENEEKDVSKVSSTNRTYSTDRRITYLDILKENPKERVVRVSEWLNSSRYSKAVAA